MGSSSSSDNEPRGACRQCGYGFSSRGDEAGAGVFSGPSGLQLVKNIIRGKVTKQELERVWQAYDSDQDNLLSAAEFRILLKDIIAAVLKILVQYNALEGADAHVPPDVVVARYRQHLKDGLNADSKSEDSLADEWRREFASGSDKKISRDDFTSKGGGGFYSALKKYLDTVELTKGTPRTSVRAESPSASANAAAATRPATIMEDGPVACANANANGVGDHKSPPQAQPAPAPATVSTANTVNGPLTNAAGAGGNAPTRQGTVNRSNSTTSIAGAGIDFNASRNTSPSLTGWDSDRSSANSVDNAPPATAVPAKAGPAPIAEEPARDRIESNVSVTRGLSPSVAMPIMAQQLLEKQEKAIEASKA